VADGYHNRVSLCERCGGRRQSHGVKIDMLETKFKVLFLLAILGFAAIPIMGILRGSPLTPFEKAPAESVDTTPSESVDPSQASREEPVREEMIVIPAGPFIRGTDHGGFDEQPQRTLVLDAFALDRYEVTNFQYQKLVNLTGHRNRVLLPVMPRTWARCRGLISLWSMYHGRMRMLSVIGKGSDSRPRRSGRRPCEDRMAVSGLGVTWSSPTEQIGPGCRMGMTSQHLSERSRLTRAP